VTTLRNLPGEFWPNNDRAGNGYVSLHHYAFIVVRYHCHTVSRVKTILIKDDG